MASHALSPVQSILYRNQSIQYNTIQYNTITDDIHYTQYTRYNTMIIELFAINARIHTQSNFNGLILQQTLYSTGIDINYAIMS